MNNQDFKALLDALNRIAKALEGKEKNNPVEIVNRFAKVYRMLDELLCDIPADKDPKSDLDYLCMTNRLKDIKKTYVKIANEILNENN